MKPVSSPNRSWIRLSCAAALSIAAAGVAQERATEPNLDVPLTAVPGDSARGRRVVRDASKATCLICHAMPIPEEPDHGTIGPPLQGIARRATPGVLRQRLVDATALNPATVMPAYYRVDGFHRVLARHRGESIYSAQDVEDVVAYLMTLTGE